MTRRQTILLSTFLVFIVIAGSAYLMRHRIEAWLLRPTASSVGQGVGKDTSVTVAAKGLTVPWEVVFLPNGDTLISERSGSLRRISARDSGVLPIAGVQQTSEGGLLGLALHPDFAQNQWLYVYYTTNTSVGLMNVVDRYRLHHDTLMEKTEIIGDIPAASNHDGGRIAFGPDRLLYVATGDAQDPASAQNTASLAGKILRLNDNGTPAAGNPFQNAVYSYGHRNVQGLAWDDTGQLWATEHGPSGVQSGYDELNKIKRGANYGWPVIRGDETRAGMERPAAHSGPDDTWAPAGMAHYKGSLYFAGLRGQSLYQATIQQGDRVSLKAHFRQQYGRLRAVVAHQDTLYITTSNTDGRGSPQAGDDKLLRIDPTIFE